MNRLLQTFKWVSDTSTSKDHLETLEVFEEFDQLLHQELEYHDLHKFYDDFSHLNNNRQPVMVHLEKKDAVQSDLSEWIKFWQFQFREHIAYLDLLLAKLPPEAFSKFSPLSSTLPENQPQISRKILKSLNYGAEVVMDLKPIALRLVHEWKKFQDRIEADDNDINVSHLYYLCKWTMIFKMTMLNAHVWIGSAYSGLIEHHIEELVAFIMRLSGLLTHTELVGYLTNIVADHLSLVAHNTTPGGPPPVRQSVIHNLNLAEIGYGTLERDGSVKEQEAYIRSATQDFHRQVPSQLSQEIPNISLPIDVYHIEREHLFALRKLSIIGTMQ